MSVRGILRQRRGRGRRLRGVPRPRGASSASLNRRWHTKSAIPSAASLGMRIQHYLCCWFICVTSADIIEPWLPCLDPTDCALPWPERDRVSGSKVSQCWEEPWCRNWLQQVAAGARPPGKRDIFMSRGWGAGGMPFSVLYLNSHLRLKQQKLKQQQQQQARQPRFSPAESGGGGAARAAALVSEARLQDYEDTPTVAQPPPPPQAHVSLRPTSLSHKQYAVLPQLFVSYGWGPLGK